jgi:uncharacterized protein YbaP (TraB family)
MGLSFWKEKQLKMVWKVEKEGKTSSLVGTSHFFRYSFKKTLSRLIGPAENVLFEGPLDDESMARIAEYGRHGEGSPALIDALDPTVVRAINRRLNERWSQQNSVSSSLQILHPPSSDFLESIANGARPWMAFFSLWYAYLDWKHSVDLEAFAIARALGKKIHFLETIDDQLAALDGIPFEGIVDFINRFDRWESYKRQLTEYYLNGDIESLMSRTIRFPTRCDSILGGRDVTFFARLRLFFAEGRAVAFVGTSHIPYLRQRLLEEGYQVTQTTS